jgi:hypothetical protein
MALVLRLQLTEEGADAERLDTLTSFLHQELLRLDVDDVTRIPAGEPPSGSRGLGAVAVGGLLVGLGSAANGLAAVISAIESWLGRSAGNHRRVRLEIAGDVLELSEATTADQDRLIELFISKHASGEEAGR